MGPSLLQAGRPWGNCCSKFDGIGAILASSWDVLGPFWLQVGSWGHVGSKMGCLGVIPWLLVVGSWGHLGSKQGGNGAIVAPSEGVLGSFWLQDEGSWGHLGSRMTVLGECWLQAGGLGHHFGMFFNIMLQIRGQSKNLQKSCIFFNGFGVVGGSSWRQVDGLGGHDGSKLGGLGATLGHLGFLLVKRGWGPSWLQVGWSWSHLGSKLKGLGVILAPSWLQIDLRSLF